MKEYSANPQPTERKYIDPRYADKEYCSYSFWTKLSPTFYPFAKLFMDNTINVNKSVKIVPLCIFELLTPCALAFWICDDGQYVKRGGVTLCTDNFELSEILLLKSVLEDKYKLECTIHNKNPEKGYYRIYISGRSLATLRGLVIEYMHTSMVYKLDK